MRDDLVDLRPLEEDDLTQVALWRQSESGRLAFFSPEPTSISGQAEWYARYLRDPTDFMFIVTVDGGPPAGTVALSNIDVRNQRAELGRVFIADDGSRQKGIATAACTLLLAYAADDLHLRKLYLRVYASNHAAIHLYEKLGFEREGLLREEVFARGRWQDVLHMARFLGRGA